MQISFVLDQVTSITIGLCFTAPALQMFSPCMCVGESRVDKRLVVMSLPQQSSVLGLIICFQLLLYFLFLFPPSYLFLNRRMSENDDIEVDSDVCLFVSSRSSQPVCQLHSNSHSSQNMLFDCASQLAGVSLGQHQVLKPVWRQLLGGAFELLIADFQMKVAHGTGE